MHCDEIESKLDRYMEDELRNTERLLVDVHLAQCYACRQTLESYREVNAAIAEALQHPEPSNDVDALMARIQTDFAARARRKTVDYTAEPIGRRFAFAAGVLIIAGFSAVWIERERSHREKPVDVAPPAIQSLSERTDRMLDDAETGDAEVSQNPGTSDGNAPL